MGLSQKVNDLLIIELMITLLQSLDLSIYIINSVDKTELFVVPLLMQPRSCFTDFSFRLFSALRNTKYK